MYAPAYTSLLWSCCSYVVVISNKSVVLNVTSKHRCRKMNQDWDLKDYNFNGFIKSCGYRELKWINGSINASAGNKKSSYLPIVSGEDQGRIITRADGGGEELLFVSQPDSGPLQHSSHNNTINIWTRRSDWSHLFDICITDSFHKAHGLHSLM